MSEEKIQHPSLERDPMKISNLSVLVNGKMMHQRVIETVRDTTRTLPLETTETHREKTRDVRPRPSK